MQPTAITSKILVAYSQCPRKAFLLFCTNEQGMLHEYTHIIEQQRILNQLKYISTLKQGSLTATARIINDLNKEGGLIINVILKNEGLAASCDVLTLVHKIDKYYEPMIIVGTYDINKEQELELIFAGFVLGKIQNKLPAIGYIVRMGERVNKFNLELSYKKLKQVLDPLKEWLITTPVTPPPVILNKHCPSCQFQELCRSQAEKEDALTLLDRMTPKAIQSYHKKGIFTVKQLSYLFQPRRSRKPTKKIHIRHRLELQALAIRTNKIYLQELPILSRQSVELFLDIEGIPDQRSYYLIGLLVSENGKCSYYPFWGETAEDQEKIWRQFLEKIGAYPEAPIYHYGAYEPHALEKLAIRYQTNWEYIRQRMINIVTFIYGKVYFPVRSNSLKDIGHFIGASWTSPNASGLQALVWRYYWQETYNSEYKQLLITYNQEDCIALQLLTDELTRIGSVADLQPTIDFIDQQKRPATLVGEQIHSRFEQILKFAHADYDKKKLHLQQDKVIDSNKEKKRGGKIGHQRYTRPIPKSTRVIHVSQKETCSICSDTSLKASKKLIKKTIIDLVFTKNGCKKTVIQYIGAEGYCIKCHRYYRPPEIEKFATSQLFGHGLQSWVIYQRMVLRLPYRIIIQAMEDQFNEQISAATIANFFRYFALYYADTESLLLKHILASPFIHADETKVNIEGVDQYVWVFTDGTHVIFRLTETREATIVHELLSGYQGVLISDFYGGYDALKCMQQKCLVHLIRDINDDLWKAPFDGEFETFVVEFKNLLVPILATVQDYGLKKIYLQKFRKQIDQFYEGAIEDKVYYSELTHKYQQRFKRYRRSLFTFIEHDGISWNNNMAERAIRHLAVQRKISTHFHKTVAPLYLLLLGITQTCRFQKKSLLKFLLSGEKDIDTF